MYKILIADLSSYKNTLADIFTKNGYDAVFCDSAFDAISKLKAYDFDLIVSEVELPGDNAFELYDYVEENYPYIPMIMVTDKNIDQFFQRIFEQGIGNVLHKPVNTKEILNLTEKLITKKKIFGLNNYLENIIEMKRMKVRKSLQINRAIDLIIDQIQKWDFKVSSRATLGLILNEMVINAVYHSHGLTQEKLDRIPVELPGDKYVDIQFCCTDDSFAISITDSNGILSKDKILESINNVIKQNMLIEESMTTGADISEFISESGRGIDLVRKLSGEYYFIIKKNSRTEIILIFKKSDKPVESDSSSLKIIEDRS
jgi:CheY-like chemotaxis protein/two-component sensor histidine kinase